MSTRTTAQTLGPCTECGTPHDACTGPDYCCDECLHFAADWDGYVQPAAVRDALAAQEKVRRVSAVLAKAEDYWAANRQTWSSRRHEVVRIEDVRRALAGDS